VSATLGPSLDIHYTDVSIMFGIALFTLWLMLAGYSIRNLSARAILSLTGYFRTRPDPWLEGAVRSAFVEFDRELAMIMKDRSGPVLPVTNRRARPAPALDQKLPPPDPRIYRPRRIP
jgi:hypothetical protein